MKILNSNIRESGPIQMTPIPELNTTVELNDESLLIVAKYIKENTYTTMQTTIGTFQEKMFQAINNTFKVEYWKTHLEANAESSHSSTTPYDKIIKYVNGKITVSDILKVAASNLLESDFEDDLSIKDDFVTHVNYDFNLLHKYIARMHVDIWSELDSTSQKLAKLDYGFDPNMVITTHRLGNNNTVEVTNLSVNNGTENKDYCQMSITTGNKISNEWTVPKSGNLVIFGWLDSSEALNNKAIPSSYCVIEANIESTGNGKNWEIIGVCSVTPAKNITYVGFNLIAHEGLVIRARTGFCVGGKSGQYSNEQDGYDTLANSTINGFKCQVFSNSSINSLN